MEISDTIQVLTKIRRAIATWAPRRGARPDALVADMNDLYVACTENRGLDELFAYDEVGSPSLTLRIDIAAEFDLQRVIKNLRTRLRLPPPGSADEIGTAGIVWSCGRYDFVYDSGSDSLRISHQYSHRRVDTMSVASIARQMIDYAIGYLEEVQTSAQEGTGAPNTDEMRRAQKPGVDRP